MIKLIIEAIIIGIYTLLIYFCLNSYINNPYLLFFLIGFFKHFLGYYLGIQSFYCNYKYSIKNFKNKNIFIQSIGEGLVFLFLFLLVGIKLNSLNFFIIGFSLHIISELVGIHNWFCN
jgi:hypothetical protein